MGPLLPRRGVLEAPAVVDLVEIDGPDVVINQSVRREVWITA